jgi:nucleotide-binding universal stress UspA family protein
MISRIVVPLDHSDVSEAALPLAAYLAERRGIPMTLLHVLEMSPEFSAYVHGVSEVDALMELEQASQKYLNELAAGIAGVEVDVAVLRGRPASQLVEYVDKLENPLVVMSSHGHSGFRRMMLGSVAARVVQTVAAPVMIVRATEEGSDVQVPSQIQRVVVPLDGSSFAEHALNATYELVTRKDIEIRLVRVPEIAAYPATMYGAASYEAVDAYMDAMRSEAETYLTGIVERLKDHEGEISWEIREGAASVAILEAAKDFNADLIAMASHGRTGFRRFLMGSVAEQVLREAHVPVMLVGPHDVEDDEDE